MFQTSANKNNSVEHSFPWNTDSCPVGQWNPFYLWNLEVHYPVLSQLNSMHTLVSFSLRSILIGTFPSVSRSSWAAVTISRRTLLHRVAVLVQDNDSMIFCGMLWPHYYKYWIWFQSVLSAPPTKYTGSTLNGLLKLAPNSVFIITTISRSNQLTSLACLLSIGGLKMKKVKAC